jgi:hypothetical protein
MSKALGKMTRSRMFKLRGRNRIHCTASATSSGSICAQLAIVRARFVRLPRAPLCDLRSSWSRRGRRPRARSCGASPRGAVRKTALMLRFIGFQSSGLTAEQVFANVGPGIGVEEGELARPVEDRGESCGNARRVALLTSIPEAFDPSSVQSRSRLACRDRRGQRSSRPREAAAHRPRSRRRAEKGRPQHAVKPPSIGKDTPEIIVAPSLSRKTIGAAISSSVAQRPRGIVLKNGSPISGRPQ